MYGCLITGLLIGIWIDQDDKTGPVRSQQKQAVKKIKPVRTGQPSGVVVHSRQEFSDHTTADPLIAKDESVRSEGLTDRVEPPASTGVNLDLDSEVNADVAEQMELSDTVMAIWKEEKAQFYRDTLALNEAEIEQIDSVSEAAGNVIQEIVGRVTMSPSMMSDDDFQTAIRRIESDEAIKVEAFMGQKRFAEAVQFRSIFNSEIESRFGVRMRVAGF